jgi:hypothetical protein
MVRALCLSFLLLLMANSAYAAARRVALVVGAGAYQAVPKLANPARDARAIEAALKRVGFETTLLIDPDRAALLIAIGELGRRSRDAEAAVFFYAGHALEAGGTNYIVPVDARIASVKDVPRGGVDLAMVGQQLDGQAQTVLLFLDACRDNPFAMTDPASGRGIRPGSGLAEPNSDASGTLIAFATAPGRTAEDGAGENSPFTTALLRYLDTPGLEVRQMLGLVRRDVRLATEGKQIPWESSALEGTFYFRPGGPGMFVAPSVPPPVIAPPSPGKPPPLEVPRDASPISPPPSGGPPVAPPPPGRVAATPPSRAPGAPVIPRQPFAQLSNPPLVPPAMEARRLDVPSRASRCHVDHVNGLRNPGGAATFMEVDGDGRGCGFRIFVHAATREPFASLVASSLPRNGTVSVADNSRVVYTPRPGFVGQDEFVVTSLPRGRLIVRVLVRPPPPLQHAG